MVLSMSPDYDSNCEYTALLVAVPEGGAPEELRAIIAEETIKATRVFAELQGIIREHCLQNSWQLRPIVDGSQLSKMFKNIPKDQKSLMSEIIHSQIKFMLSNPQISREEVNQALYDKYSQYR
jgi:hypothetical protein